jgi:DEAD/DEAH box helicase domain-containing protein
MFGFPTRVRLLFTRLWPKNRPWPPTRNTVERELDIAVSQFAPGSETVKDKQVHTACGVAEFFPAGRLVRARPGFHPAKLSDPNVRYGLCENCQALEVDQAQQPPVPDGGKPAARTCPVCKQEALVPVDAREPRGFFTDLQPRDFDGSFEYTPRATRPRLSFDPSLGKKGKSEAVLNCRVHTFQGEVAAINDNGGEGGFNFREVRLDKQQDGACAVVEDAQAERIQPLGPTYRVALLSRRVTDVLLTDLLEWPKGVRPFPLGATQRSDLVVGRAAWYSFAFFLRTAAAALLDVDINELEAGVRTTVMGTGEAAAVDFQAFLNDRLENGAGYCTWLSRSENFRRLLDHCRVEVKDSLAEKWTDEQHLRDCSASCNKCLREFNNQSYHGLLDWRLALDMARLAADPKAVIDLTTNWGSRPNPWRTVQAIIPAVLDKLEYSVLDYGGGLRAFQHRQDANQVRVEIHPLWQEDHEQVVKSLEVLRTVLPKCSPGLLNPFLLLRRPADYV